jgi:hypothetical protein
MPEINYKSTIQDRINRRIEIIRSLDTNKKRALALEYCKHNLIDFVNDFLVTYDPRVIPATIPFYLFPKQEKYLIWRQERKRLKQNGVVEKSRDLGLSWLNCADQLHSWLFTDGYKGSMGSRKIALVDRIGDMDSLFEKLRFLLRHLPKWFLPQDFDWNKHDNFSKLINPNNGSTITGEGGTSIGRGGRSTLYDVDEAAFLSAPQSIDSALSNNTDVIIYTSSVNGMNFFYKKRMSTPDEQVFRFHWKDDPRKNEAWYQQMKAKYDPVIIASELDLDYGASVEGIFIPASWVMAAVNLKIPAVGQKVAGLDVATTGKNQSVFTMRQGAVVFPPIAWSNMNTAMTAYKTRDLMAEHQITHLNFDSDGLGEGVDATFSMMEKLDFTYEAVHGASKPSELVWEGEQRTSAEKFANKRAELWGLLRDRFRKTYDHVNGIAEHNPDELISIPNDTRLITQLSQPQGKRSTNGKILIESKEDMKKRGVESPDFADSLALTMEQPGDSWFDVGESRNIYGLISNY